MDRSEGPPILSNNDMLVISGEDSKEETSGDSAFDMGE